MNAKVMAMKKQNTHTFAGAKTKNLQYVSNYIIGQAWYFIENISKYIAVNWLLYSIHYSYVEFINK